MVRAVKTGRGKGGEPLYEVRQITGWKYINGKKYFHVMWKRTGAKLCKKTSRSFEPEENVQKCWDLVVAYEERERTKQFIKNDDGYPAAKLESVLKEGIKVLREMLKLNKEMVKVKKEYRSMKRTYFEIFVARDYKIRYNNEVIVPQLKRKHQKMVIQFDEMNREYARLNAYVAIRIPLVITLPNGVDLHHKFGKLSFQIEWDADEL